MMTKLPRRALALAMALLLALPLLASCGFDEDYTGPTFEVYFSNMPTTFDPAYAYLDDTAMQVMSLLYEGLFSYDEDGKLVNALAEDYRWVTQNAEKSEYVLEIDLKESAWSDGQSVTADQVVFAWRRLLNPEMSSDAACLLYDIKNAQAAKEGTDADIGIYDIGAYAVDTRTIRIEFDHEVDLDQFFRNLASPALVPLRDDVVEKNKMVDWDSTAAVVLANGPFYLKTYAIGDSMRLERNRYYRRDVENDKMDKYVTPYRIEVNFGREHITETDPVTGETVSSEKFDSTSELNNYLWSEGIMDYYSNLPLESRAEYEGQTSSVARRATAAVYFNVEREPFTDARVRRALSMAIDRAELAKRIVSADPASGLIPAGVLETTQKAGDDFRAEGGELISPSGDLDGAKALLREAGVSSGSFELSYKLTDPIDVEIASYLKETWSKLGFSVSDRKYYSSDEGANYQSTGYRVYTDDVAGYDGLIEDCYTDAYTAGDFDVILRDVCQMTTSAFSTLAPFSTAFCGTGVDLSQPLEEEAQHETHITGYASDEYDSLIAAAFAEKSDTPARAQSLHAAEKLLLEDAPVSPLLTYRNAYLEADNVKKLTFDWYGNAVFTRADDSTFEYVPEEE